MTIKNIAFYIISIILTMLTSMVIVAAASTGHTLTKVVDDFVKDYKAEDAEFVTYQPLSDADMEELEQEYDVILERKEEKAEGSYTAYLFEQGLDKILKKVGEECTETVIAAKNNNNTETVYEITDLLYHVLVMMAHQGITPEDIEAELAKRVEKRGNLKKFHQVDKNS